MDKILLIKEVRNLTGCGLKEAKETVEEYQTGNLPEREELIRIVAEKVKNRVPRSEDIRKRIRDHVRSIKYMNEEVEEMCEGDFGEEDISEIRLCMEEIADNALDIKDQWTFRLEEAIYDEQEGK